VDVKLFRRSNEIFLEFPDIHTEAFFSGRELLQSMASATAVATAISSGDSTASSKAIANAGKTHLLPPSPPCLALITFNNFIMKAKTPSFYHHHRQSSCSRWGDLFSGREGGLRGNYVCQCTDVHLFLREEGRGDLIPYSHLFYSLFFRGSSDF
jgi:hypothetical protein